MFENLTAPENVVAVRLSAKMTADDIINYKAILEDKLGKHKRLGMCVDLTGLSDMTGNALVEGAKADLEFISHIGQFERCAFISDKEWPQAVARFMDPVFPTFEMKVFTPDQKDDAIKWAAAHPDTPQATAPAFRFLQTSNGDVFAFEINGVISSEEMPRVIKEFETFLESHEKVRLLNRMTHFGGIDPAVFMQGGLVSMKLAAMQKVERYAIVGAPGWMRKIIETMNPVFPDIDMRAFSAEQEDEAWDWLEAQPAK